MKVLVVEDSPEIVETIKLCVSIRWPDCEVIDTDRGTDAVSLVTRELPDLVLLDLNLADMDGLDVLQDIQRISNVPIIIVSGRGDELSRVRGLEMGADDYIVKPFSHTELLARIRAMLRRSGNQTTADVPEVINGKGLTIDLDKRRLYRDGELVEMTNSEWNLLAYLARNEGKTIPTHVLATSVWGSMYVEGAAIRMCVRRLRLKLNDNTHKPQIIRSHRGVGYSFELPREGVTSG